MRTLDGRKVAILESRRRDELAAMVERLGGTPVMAPAVLERPSEDDAGPVLTRIARGDFRVAIVLTGAGATALLAEAERRGVLDEVRRALANMLVVCRGPKPQAALKRHGLTAGLSTARPHTSQELLDALASTHLEGVPVLLLHYGERNTALSDALRARGGLVEDVCLYEWALPEDVEPLARVIQRIIAGEIDALLVTSQVQFRFLMEIAGRDGLTDSLVQALNERVIVGAVGPVCAAALRAGGVVPDVLPASPNSAALVGAVADYFDLSARPESRPEPRQEP
jgi:uroporphyrinogen-III synthase